MMVYYYKYLSENQVESLKNCGISTEDIIYMDEEETGVPNDEAVIKSLVNVINNIKMDVFASLPDHFDGFCYLVGMYPYDDNPTLVSLTTEQGLMFLKHQSCCLFHAAEVLRRWLTPSVNGQGIVIGSVEEFLGCTELGFTYDHLDYHPLMCLKFLRNIQHMEKLTDNIISKDRLLYHEFQVYEGDLIHDQFENCIQDFARHLYNDEEDFYKMLKRITMTSQEFVSHLPRSSFLPIGIVGVILDYLSVEDIMSISTV